MPIPIGGLCYFDTKPNSSLCSFLEYAKKELTRPERTVTSTVRVSGGKANVTSVRTASDIPKDAIFRVMEAINEIVAPAPIAIGDVLCEDIAGTGVALTATKAVEAK